MNQRTPKTGSATSVKLKDPDHQGAGDDEDGKPSQSALPE